MDLFFGFLFENWGEYGLGLFLRLGRSVVLGEAVGCNFFYKGKGGTLLEFEGFDHSEPERGKVEELFWGANQSSEGNFEVLVELDLEVAESMLEDLFEV